MVGLVVVAEMAGGFSIPGTHKGKGQEGEEEEVVVLVQVALGQGLTQCSLGSKILSAAVLVSVQLRAVANQMQII